MGSIKKNKELVAELIKKSADIEYKDTYHMTALHYACDKGFYDIVKILVNSGADINSRGYKNCTPVYYAIGVENTDIVKYLIEKKARFDVVNDNSETPVSYAITNSLKTKNLSIVKLLIENGADVNSRNNNDIPFIMLAAAYGNTEMLKFLIDRGADVNIAYQANITALINAALNNKLECVKILVENGADTTGKIIKDFTFNGDDFKAGSTALDLAKQLEYDEISEYLSNTSNIKRNARKKQNSSDDFNTTMPWDKFFLVLLDISEQKNPEKIIKLCIKYSKNYANSEEDRFEALTNAGRISYYVKKKPKEAIVLLKKAILLNLHGSSFALGILGSSYMAISTNDPQLQEKALICLQLASKTGSDNPGINHDLARAYSLFNDSEKAFYYYIKAISNNNGKFLSDVQTDPAFKNMISSPEFKKFYNNRNTFQSNITAFENAVNQKNIVTVKNLIIKFMEYLPETSFPVINAYFKIGELSDIEVSGLEKMKNYATAASLLKGIEPIGYFRTECFYGVTRNGLRAVKNTEDEEKFKEYWEKAFPDGFRMTDDFPSDPASKKNDFIWNPLLKNLKENEYPEISSNLGL